MYTQVHMHMYVCTCSHTLHHNYIPVYNDQEQRLFYIIIPKMGLNAHEFVQAAFTLKF